MTAMLDGLRIFFGTLYVLFLPGFAWSFVLFRKATVSWLERIAISLGLSIVIVPMAVFWLNWIFNVRITLLNTSLIVSALAILPTVYLLGTRAKVGRGVASASQRALRRLRQRLNDRHSQEPSSRHESPNECR